MQTEQLVRDVWGYDPIAGRRALEALVALGDEGEALVFSAPLVYPRTIQATRRVLRYVATRKGSIGPRLLERLDDQERYGDADACALLFAGLGADAASNELVAQLERGFDNHGADARYCAWGFAGGSAWLLRDLVKRDRFLWEKLATFAFRGGCAAVARVHEESLNALADLVTWEWTHRLSELDPSPDAPISDDAIHGSELWGEANNTFIKWRRGAVADAVLRKWAGHAHWRVRDFGAQILAGLGFRRTATPMTEWLRRETVPAVRRSLLAALQRTDTPAGADAVLAFFAATGEGDANVARCAWRATDATRAREALMRVAGGGGTPADEALVSLARMGVRDAHLPDAIESEDDYRRVNAALALAYLGDTGESERLAAMQREAATSLERVYLAAALALLHQREAVDALHEALIQAAAAGWPKQADIFFVHSFLQEAVLDALAQGGAAAELRAVWAAELEPLDPVPQPVAVPPAGESAGAARPRPARAPVTRAATTRPRGPRKPDLLLVTVNPNETKALLESFAEAVGRKAEPVAIGDRVYRDLGAVNGARCMHALSEMGTAGPGGAHETVSKGIRALSPAAVIFVGIAFGIDEKKQAIGDILLAKQLRLYDLQRVGAEVVLRGDRPHASAWLINYFNGFAQTSWSGAPVRTGVLLTGDKLVDSIDYRGQLRQLEPEAIGGEMEGAGLYVASHDMKVDWIVIKAICDWADGQKSKNMKARQQKASCNAASFVIQALQSVPLRPAMLNAP